MSTLDLTQFKYIDQKTKDLIRAYIHDARKLLPSGIAYYNIPMEVTCICALLYYTKEEWNPDCIGPGCFDTK